MNPLAGHIAGDKLVDFVDGRMPITDRHGVERHLASCGRCSRQAAAFKHVIGVMRTDDSQDAPDYVVNRAIRLFRTHRLETAPASVTRRLLARLRLDSARQQFAFGVRSTAVPARELLFDIDDENELEVRIEGAEGGWRVVGQILGTCAGSGGQVLLEGSAGQSITELTPMCEFSLPPQPGAIYRLILQLEDVEVEVPILELRA